MFSKKIINFTKAYMFFALLRRALSVFRSISTNEFFYAKVYPEQNAEIKQI